MYFGRYCFDGDPGELEAAYQKMSAGLPVGNVEMQVVVARLDGLDVYDACPDADTFRAFSTAPEFRAGVEAAGMPTPRVEELGDVVTAILKRPGR